MNMIKDTFNRAPYYDDWNPNSPYMRVLWRPGRAVQGRELNVAQSIMFGQQSQFAGHVFKNGSKVSNARSTMMRAAYVRLKNESAPVSRYPEGSIVVGRASGLRGRVITCLDPINDDPATIYVSYLNTAIDGVTSMFVPGETVEFRDENDVTVGTADVRCPSCPGSPETAEVWPVGHGHIFVIDEGAFYFEGMFIQNARQMVVVSKYSQPFKGDMQPFSGRKIGFDFVESIVGPETDASLLDPSLGYPNSTAPGADRYKVELVLSTREYDAEDGERFILLAKMNKRYVLDYQKSDSEYAAIMDDVARGRFETNGNFTVRPYRCNFYEHKKKDRTDPRGWDVDGSEENLVALISPSVGYVKGYRVETIADTPVLVKKARETNKLGGYIRRFDQRQNIQLQPTGPVVWPGLAADLGIVNDQIVELRDAATGQGAVIGTARFNDFEKVSGINVDHSAVYRYYITEMAVTAAGKTLSDVKSVTHPATNFIAEVVPASTPGAPVVQDAANNLMVFAIDRQNIKSLRDRDNNQNGSITITVRKKLTATLDSAGQYTFATSTDEFFEAIGPRTVMYTTQSNNTNTIIDIIAGTNLINGTTTLAVNLGAGHAGRTVTIFTDVLRTNQREKKKNLSLATFTTSTVPEKIVGSRVLLGHADGFRLQKVELYDHADPQAPALVMDVSDHYRFSGGATDTFYGEAFVEVTKELPSLLTNDMRLHVTFQYFEHSGQEGYFTVDSYSDILNDPTSGMTYADIPAFISSAGKVIPLMNAFDFRPMKIGDRITGNVPAANSTAIFDIEYYLPRADIIQINKDGMIYPKYGVASDQPALPNPDPDSMVLYHVFLNAYTYNLSDVKTKFIENKRFTMRDIGRLETRIENLEVYTALSMLEKSAKDLSVKDADGLDRFKNGMIVDDFKQYQAADLPSNEFRAAMNRTDGVMRPRFKTGNFQMVPSKEKSTGVRWHGNVATLPYTTVVFSENPYATKHISVNPYFQFAKVGKLVLSPNMDTWTDVTHKPEVIVDVDTGVEGFKELADAAGILGTNWGSWGQQNTTIVGSTTRTRNKTTSSSYESGRTVIDSNTAVYPDGSHTVSTINADFTTVTTSYEETVRSDTIKTSQTRKGTEKLVESNVTTYSIDDIVKDVQIVPFARPALIQMYGTGLKAKTRVWVFYDGENVSEFARDISRTLTNDNASTMLGQIEYGSPLFTDDKGNLIVELSLPEGRFFSGKSEIEISNDPSGKHDPDVETTYASATYFSSGLDVTKQTHTLNITTPHLNTREVSEERSTETTRDVVTDTKLIGTDTYTDNMTFVEQSWNYWNTYDPVAQQVFNEDDQFTTGIDVYFKEIDMSSDMIWFEMREMVNGYPTAAALSRREFKPSELTFSEDSTVPFHVDWNVPVFLQKGLDYCFVVGGYSPDTRIWVAKLGQEVVDMPGKIVETQPTAGSSFRSQNGKTWNAEQFETIKYKMYRANFEAGAKMEVVLENEQIDANRVALETNPLEFEAGLDLVRVHWKSHGFTETDRVTLSLYEDVPLKIKPTALPPQIGQFLHTASGSGTISKLTKTAVADEFIVELVKTSGRIKNGEAWTADATSVQIRDNLLLTSIGVPIPTMSVVNEATGVVTQAPEVPFFINGQIGGIDIEQIAGSHVIKDIDSPDSFIIQLTVPATITGRFGGDDVYSNDYNTRFELVNVAGSYLPYSSIESWTYTGTGHGDQKSQFANANYTKLAPREILVGGDIYLEQPNKIACKLNEQRIFGTTERSASVTASFQSRSTLMTPVVDCDTFSLTTVTNEVGWLTEETYNVAPNALGRLVPETDKVNGSESFKYVTRNVFLSNPATDVLILLDYNKDVTNDFAIFVKRVPPYGSKPMEQYDWEELNIPTKKNSANRDEHIELRLMASEVVEGWTNPNGDPIEYTGLKVKLVGRAKNSARPPTFMKFRCIAIT